MSKLLIFEIHPRKNSCANCVCRKENYPQIPKICLECGFLKEREAAYVTRVPVLQEDVASATVPENIKLLMEVLEDDIPVDGDGRIQAMFFDWTVGTPKQTIVDYFTAILKRFETNT